MVKAYDQHQDIPGSTTDLEQSHRVVQAARGTHGWIGLALPRPSQQLGKTERPGKRVVLQEIS